MLGELLLHAGSTASLLWVRTESGLSAFALAYGATVGMNSACNCVVFASLFGTDALGRIQGVLAGANVASTGSGPVLFALAHRHWGSFAPATRVAAAGLAATSLAALVVDARALPFVAPARGRRAARPEHLADRQPLTAVELGEHETQVV